MDTEKAWTDIAAAVRALGQRAADRYAAQFPAQVWHHPVTVETEAGTTKNFMVDYSIN